MTAMRDSSGKEKPTPEGFDVEKPPPVYYAPECAGSRPGDYPAIEQDLAMLRAHREGTPLPRIMGHVHLYPFRGWPVLSGPDLEGARIKIAGQSATLWTTTDETGSFSLAEAPAGEYYAWAYLPPFRTDKPGYLYVPEVGCGHANIKLTTISTVQGIVLNPGGIPVPDIRIQVQLQNPGAEDALEPYSLDAITDSSGQFEIAGLPDADVYLSAGWDYPSTSHPYQRVYYPKGRSRQTAATLRLKPGEHRRSMVLWLEAPLERISVRVRVFHNDGRPAKAAVRAINAGGVIAESALTDATGLAELPCLRGKHYQLEAVTLRSLPWRGNLLKSSSRPFRCDGTARNLSVILEHSAPY